MVRLLKFLALVLALLVLGIVTSPYWLGAVVPAVARRFGATFGSYSRIGYGRFAVNDVVVRRPGVTVQVSRAEMDTPWLWGLRHLQHNDRPAVIGTWKVDVVEHKPTAARQRASGWMPLQADLVKIARTLDHWLPGASLGRGEVNWPGGAVSTTAVTWRNRTLHLAALKWRQDIADVDAVFLAGNEEIQLRATITTRPLALRADSRGAEITGALVAWSQTAPFSFTFDPAGWVPVAGKITAESWKVPASDLKLGGYAEVLGGLQANWDHGRFVINSDLRGQATQGRGAPDLHVILRANGDREAYVVEQLDVAAPGIAARLSEPIRATFHDSQAGPASRFSLQINLAELPWFKAEGRVQGEVQIQPRSSAWPLFTYTATGDSITISQWQLTASRIRGRLDWPRLVLDSGDFTAAGDARLAVSGTCDFSSKQLEAVRAEGRITQGLVQPWLPKTILFSGAEVVVKASGPWAELKHEGAVQIEQLQVPEINPAAVKVWWHGTGPEIEDYEAGIQAAATEIISGGAVHRDSIELKKLVWRHGQQDRLSLERPATIHWRPGVRIDALDLVGQAGELRLSGEWGEAGAVRFFARGIAGEWWRDFVPRAPFGWSIDTFSLTANWNAGPVTVDTTGLIFLDFAGRERMNLDFAAKSNGANLVVERLRAVQQNREFVTLHGQLPLALWAGAKPRVEFGRSAEFSVEGKVDPDAPGWAEIGERTGVRLERPDLSLHLSGSWEQPRGSAKLDVAKLQIDERFGTIKWPKIETVHAELVADGKQVKLAPLEATIEGQKLTIAATMPTDEKIWTKLRQNPAGVLRDEVEVSIQTNNTDVAAFAPYASGVLLPQGRLDADLTLSARGSWKGYLKLRELGTRPLGSLGPVRDISAELTLEGRKAVLSHVQAAVGGQPVQLSGFIEFPVDQAPRFDLSAKGQNLPFVRQAGLLVRGNVDVKLQSGSGSAQPLVSGEVELRDGIFLSDVRALVPHGGSSPERRPPYFAVSNEPFNRWRLDMNVRGERFLRARTTLFNGVASTKFHLVGTLGDPRAIGELRIEDGQVLFPFARFLLQDATVRLSEENPYDPQLAIFGNSRRYGYDLRLELTGSASSPNLTFSSNPPLNSEQVLLIVMAGETPKNEVTYTTNQRFARLGTFFGQSLLGSLGGGGGGSDRLTISSGESISDQGRETYDVEYKIKDRWSLTGEYDEFDEYNAGLKWRVLPKTLRGETHEKR